MAVRRDPQSFILNNFKFIQVGEVHLFEPDGDGTVKDESQWPYMSPPRILLENWSSSQLSSKTQLWAWSRVEGELGIQSDAQDFIGSVQRGHLVVNSHGKKYGKKWILHYHLPVIY